MKKKNNGARPKVGMGAAARPIGANPSEWIVANADSVERMARLSDFGNLCEGIQRAWPIPASIKFPWVSLYTSNDW